ncbi:MAG TPA: hypothetical protein VFK05_31205 [Polyangiaceae bacterium]|nr:hypothetical protein [Polyangiaceae bacterium]
MHYVAGSAELFLTFHDQELDTDCRWLQTAAGAPHHCFPPDAKVQFLDDACKQPVIVDDALQEGALISAALPPVSCAGESPSPRVSYRVGMTLPLETVDGQPLPLYGMQDSKCQPAGSHSGKLGPPYLRVLEQVLEGELAAGHESTISVGGGLSVRRILADDGSNFTLDAALATGVVCQLQVGGRCVPGVLGFESDSSAPSALYSDENCEQRTFATQMGNFCGEPEFGLETQADGLHVFELSRALKAYIRIETDGSAGAYGTAADGASPMGCESADQYDGGQYVRGKEVTTQFPLAQQRQTGEGPLFLSRFAAPDPEHFLPLDAGHGFEDADKNPCEVVDTHDDALRCLPYRSMVDGAGYFQDADCKQQLYQRSTGLVSSAANSVTDLRRLNAAENGPDQLFSLTVYNGALYRVVTSQCQPTQAPPGVELLALDQVLPLSLLPSVELKAL